MAEDKTGGVSDDRTGEERDKEVDKGINTDRDDRDESNTIKTNQIGDFDYFLFLIFVLLLVGSQHTFSPYINLFQRQAGDIKKALDTFSITAKELKKVMAAPRKIYQ